MEGRVRGKAGRGGEEPPACPPKVTTQPSVYTHGRYGNLTSVTGHWECTVIASFLRVRPLRAVGFRKDQNVSYFPAYCITVAIITCQWTHLKTNSAVTHTLCY